MSLVLGTNCGFVTVAPTADPNCSDMGTRLAALAFKVTSPTGSYKITEIGWYQSRADNHAATYTAGLYGDSTNYPGSLVVAECSGQSTAANTAGWYKYTGLNIPLTSNTPYWLAVGIGSGSGYSSRIYIGAAAGGQYYTDEVAESDLPTPYPASQSGDTRVLAIYAVYAAAGATELDHTVKPSGGDFTTLADALSHLASSHSDLVASSQYAIITISGSWGAPDTAAASCSGVTTDATHYIKITTDTANRASLAWNTAKYNLSVSNATALLQANDFVILDGLQISTPAVNADNQNPLKVYKASWGAGAITTIIDCLIKGANSATYIQKGIDDEGATTDIVNTCVYGVNTAKAGSVGIAAAPTTATNIYSTTVIGGTTGILRTSGTCIAKNCYVGTAGAGGCYSGTITMTTCASSDTTGSAAGLRNIAVSTTADSTHAGFVNVTAGAEDFHIKAGSPLIGTGTDTHGDASPLNFSVDIDGDARS